ncbi:hypothetical protein N8664_02785 [Verrucomicrobia bacterium]|nr:hypothetical protein [Verrucomicrobiota bacterium]
MKATQSARKHSRLRYSEWSRVVTRGTVKVKIYRICPKEGIPIYQIADYSLRLRNLRSVASQTSALDQARQLKTKMARGEVRGNATYPPTINKLRTCHR